MNKESKRVRKKEVSYSSKNEKLYNLKKIRVLNTKKALVILIALSIILLPLAESLLIKSLNFKKQEAVIQYVEDGKIDYKVYLKNNNYYTEKYLEKGMEYVSSIISTVNPLFTYEIHSTDNLELMYSYKITGTLLISKDSESSPLYTKTFNLATKEKQTINSDYLNISEDLVIDYDEYNSLVNKYKRDFGISANSKLVLKMDINVVGKHPKNDDQIALNRTLQMSIPLSEQTIQVNMDTGKIDNVGVLFTKGIISINSYLMFIVAIVSLVIVLLLLITSISIYIKFKKRNIYYLTLDKYLNDYDRIIINGTFKNTNIDETKFENIVTIDNFQELIDAAENLSLPILFYEVIPGELSFFIITNDKTLYKYILDKASLVKKQSVENKKVEELKKTKIKK
jgi:hypothetical protein